MSGAAVSVDALDEYLRPVPVLGAVVQFELAGYRSTATRQMLQLRMRMTARAFGTGTEVVAANVAEDGAAIHVDAAALSTANAGVRSALEAGPEAGVAHVRRLIASRTSLDWLAGAFRARVARRARPERTAFVRYLLAAGTYQALGGLKFCLSPSLQARLAALVDDPAVIDDLLAPEGPGLWSTVTARELALADARLREPAARYQDGLVRHRRDIGYLGGEDVEFRAQESLDAIDARVAALGAGGRAAVAAERRRLRRAVAEDRERKARARRLFAERVASQGEGGVATVVSHLLLARALTAHEDLNRRAKLRLLRDLRDLTELAGLPLEHAGLADFVAACPSRPETRRRSVVRSA